MSDLDKPGGRGVAAMLVLATAIPPLLAFNLPPSPTLLGQCLSMGLWGAVVGVAATATRDPYPTRHHFDTGALQGASVCYAAGCVLSAGLGALPMALGLSAMFTLVCFAVVAQWATGHGQSAEHNAERGHWFLTGLIVAGLLSAGIAVLQVGFPDWVDGNWIARSGLPGRAVGNLRQPNHLSSLLLLALIASVGLFAMDRLRAAPAIAGGLLMLWALVLTGSRTALLGALLLAAWGLCDRRLSRAARWALVSTPVVFAAMWFGTATWSHVVGHAIGGEGRLSISGGGDISSSRFAIWSNTLAMIRSEPWFGVGFGEFNIAWTLTAFPGRPVAFFDHTHNLPLQLLVELGIPLGMLTLALLLAALLQARQRAWSCDGVEGPAKRASFMIVLMIGLHSLLEYPLWYAYFLLPTAFAWGYALGQRDPSQRPVAASGPRQSRALRLAGLAITLASAAAVLDYYRIAVIYEPPSNAAPLEERIARGQRSLLFGHHADYAAATAFGEPKAPLSESQVLAFQRAPHHLLDIRLMIAWSQALAAQGEVDKARWLAARIREFRNPGADEYFEPCANPAEAAQAFQCQAPQRSYQWREFVTR